jgi:hypothetical protein
MIRERQKLTGTVLAVISGCKFKGTAKLGFETLKVKVLTATIRGRLRGDIHDAQPFQHPVRRTC